MSDRPHAPSDRTDKKSLVGRPMTQRELIVCKLAVTGLTNKAIANKLHISEGTVKCHLFAAYGKRGWKNRVEMTRAISLEEKEAIA